MSRDMNRRRRADRLASYSAAATATATTAALGSAMLVGTAAEAAIVPVVFIPYGETEAGPISIAPYAFDQFDLNGDSSPDITLKNYVFLGGPYQGATIPYGPGKLVGFQGGPNNLQYVSALAEGDEISSATIGGSFFGAMAYGATNPAAEFNSVTGAFIGFSFPIDTVAHYGWIRVDVDNATSTLTVIDAAYNDVPGAPILAGQTIPSPGSLALLAAGAAGLAGYRQRRDHAA